MLGVYTIHIVDFLHTQANYFPQIPILLGQLPRAQNQDLFYSTRYI
jgi:hypothetical protein